MNHLVRFFSKLKVVSFVMCLLAVVLWVSYKGKISSAPVRAQDTQGLVFLQAPFNITNDP